MTRLGVRQAIAAYLNTAQISCVGAVYESRNYVQEQDYEQRNLNGVISEIGSAGGSGCVLIVNLVRDTRAREALTGRGQVNDTIKHSVAIELYFANNGGDAQVAQADYDAVVDGMLDAIRVDPTLGTGAQSPGSIWSAGEYAPWIDHEQTSPYTGPDGMTVQIVGAMRFEAWEWIAS